MIAAADAKSVDRLLVVIPNWVGDVVLASPVLAALREHFRQAHISYLMRPYVAEIVAGGGWHDSEAFWPRSRGWRQIAETRALARQLRGQRLDTAILLTNSFRSALVARMARIPCRVGYNRDWRGWLLTDRLRPLRRDGQYVPSPVLPYYIKLAERVGCSVTDRRLRIGVTPRQEEAGQALLRAYHLDNGTPYAAINPGALSSRWLRSVWLTWWHSTQTSTPNRCAPWPRISPWQAPQVSLATIWRRGAGVVPSRVMTLKPLEDVPWRYEASSNVKVTRPCMASA